MRLRTDGPRGDPPHRLWARRWWCTPLRTSSASCATTARGARGRCGHALPPCPRPRSRSAHKEHKEHKALTKSRAIHTELRRNNPHKCCTSWGRGRGGGGRRLPHAVVAVAEEERVAVAARVKHEAVVAAREQRHARVALARALAVHEQPAPRPAGYSASRVMRGARPGRGPPAFGGWGWGARRGQSSRTRPTRFAKGCTTSDVPITCGGVPARSVGPQAHT